MKIAFIVHDYHRHGGHARYVAELASRFKKDHEVHVFANRWEEPNPENITFHKVPAITWKEITKVLSFILPATWMAPKGFDIIHAQGLCGLRHDLATAHFIQTTWLSALAKRGLKGGWISAVWRYIVAPLEQYAMGPKCSKTVIAISDRIVADLGLEYGIKDNVCLVYHGVDLDKFNQRNNAKFREPVRTMLGLGPNDFVSLFVGNLQKGACAAISAIAKVSDAHLVLVSGSNNKRETDLANKLGVSARIHWVPLTRQVEKYFAAADCFVFPTVYEPFGMVISEAMASGLPVITNKNAGAADLIRDGETGFLLDEPWDSEEIAYYLKILSADRSVLAEMGKSARLAIEPYTWDRCAAETFAIYQQLISNKQKSK